MKFYRPDRSFFEKIIGAVIFADANLEAQAFLLTEQVSEYRQMEREGEFFLNRQDVLDWNYVYSRNLRSGFCRFASLEAQRKNDCAWHEMGRIVKENSNVGIVLSI